MKLSIAGMIVRFGKISNNTLMIGGNNFETEFTIPLSGLMLDRWQLNAAMGDITTWDCWYKSPTEGKVAAPCDWWTHSNGEFPIPDEYQGDWLLMALPGDKVLEFFADEPEETDGKKSKKAKRKPAFRLTKIVLIPRHGGLTEVKASLHVRPGLGKENLILQERQHSEVKLSFSETKPTPKDATQVEMPLEQPKGQSMADFHRLSSQSNIVSFPSRDDGHRDPESVSSGPTATHTDATVAAEGSGEETPEPETQASSKAEPNVTSSDAGEASKSPAEPDESVKRKALAVAAERATSVDEFERIMREEIEKHSDRPAGVIDGTVR